MIANDKVSTLIQETSAELDVGAVEKAYLIFSSSLNVWEVMKLCEPSMLWFLSEKSTRWNV